MSLERTRRGKRQAGKAFGFLSIMRVPEYLVFDPHNGFLTRQIRAWQRLGDAMASWQPETDGRYHSRTLPVSFAIDGPLLRVFDPDGQPVPYWFEVGTENADLRQRNLSLRQRVTNLEAELERVPPHSTVVMRRRPWRVVWPVPVPAPASGAPCTP